MNEKEIKNLLESLAGGETSVDKALHKLRHFPFSDIGFAKVDLHRELRQGHPEVIFAEGKDWQKIVSIMEVMDRNNQNILVTRLDKQKAKKVKDTFKRAEYYGDSKVLRLINGEIKTSGKGTVLVVAAGTSDIPVAEEAALTAETMGNKVDTIYDVGVAGIHRLLDQRDRLLDATVIIAVAGMEGALPSVIGGLVSSPIIAVPTSIGYGASFNGLAALLAMLNSCASGVTVVNIDNGFGAGFAANRINRIQR